MEQTANFGLNQWEKTDRIQMEDFNADNAKVEAALSRCGNCRVVTGSYEGTGAFGSGAPNQLNFGAEPVALMLSGDTNCVFMFRDCPFGPVFYTTNVHQVTVSWTDTGVSWYHSKEPLYQMNEADKTYFYAALFQVDE